LDFIILFLNIILYALQFQLIKSLLTNIFTHFVQSPWEEYSMPNGLGAQRRRAVLYQKWLFSAFHDPSTVSALERPREGMATGGSSLSRRLTRPLQRLVGPNRISSVIICFLYHYRDYQ
jgi:hypothetical protein